MSSNSFVIVFVPLLVPLVLKTALFVAVFRWRKQKVTLLTSFLLAGAPILLSLIPLPLPRAIAIVAGIGVAIYLLSQYTEVKLVPEGIVTIIGVEAVSRATMAVFF